MTQTALLSAALLVPVVIVLAVCAALLAYIARNLK
jgi:hypothetical protein